MGAEYTSKRREFLIRLFSLLLSINCLILFTSSHLRQAHHFSGVEFDSVCFCNVPCINERTRTPAEQLMWSVAGELWRHLAGNIIICFSWLASTTLPRRVYSTTAFATFNKLIKWLHLMCGTLFAPEALNWISMSSSTSPTVVVIVMTCQTQTHTGTRAHRTHAPLQLHILVVTLIRVDAVASIV